MPGSPDLTTMDDRPHARPGQSPQALQERLISFAVAVGTAARRVRKDDITTPIIEQVVRAATSPAANYAEACAAPSRRAFVHRMHICLGELRETRVLLVLLARLGPSHTALPLAECDELIAIFVTSIKTATRRLASPGAH